MTPSKYIKAQGLPNLQYVADKVGKHRDTINNWYHAEYALFEVVVAGCVSKKTKTVVITSQEELDAYREKQRNAEPQKWNITLLRTNHDR